MGINWSALWKLQLPENVKFFFWMALHDSLPTNAFRAHRHCTTDTSCQRCGSGHETLLHALRDCNDSKKIWRSLAWDQQPLFFDQDCYNWIISNIHGAHGVAFAIICWFIWKARNASTFEDVSWEPWYMVNQIATLHGVLHDVYGKNPVTKGTRQVTWSSPPPDFVKINVDGSSLGNPGRSGFGGVIRNSHGEWIMGFSGFCGVTTNINSELMAIQVGLKLAWDKDYRDVICESDSLRVQILYSVLPLQHPN